MAGIGLDNQLRSRSLAPQMKETQSKTEYSEPTVDLEKSASSQMKGGGGKVALCCFLGIFISYFVYGLLQEKM